MAELATLPSPSMGDDLDQCSAEELIFRIQLANAEREQAELVARSEQENFKNQQVALEDQLRHTTGMEPDEFEEFVGTLPEKSLTHDAIKPLKGTSGERPLYEGQVPPGEPEEYVEAISEEVRAASMRLREAQHKEELLVEEVVELKKVRNRLFGDNEGTVAGIVDPLPSLMADPVNEISIEEVLLLNGSKMHGVENMLSLRPMCEATVAESLQARFQNQQPYSSIDAESLVVVNPNAWLPSSSRAMARFYNGKPFLAPHVNSQAQALVSGIGSDGRNRSLFLRGESGAGKSTAFNHLLDFFEMSMANPERVQQVKHAQKVLSAFTNCMSGNADSSSRASTSVELQLDGAQQLVGASWTLAGLEVSRVTECYEGERSFHVLYYVANGTSPPEQEALHFHPDENFEWLTQNGVHRVPGLDDEAAYHELKQSLLSLEFSAKERAYLLRMVSLVLNLGNLKFSKIKSATGSSGGISVGPTHTLEGVATMLRCDVPAVADALIEGFSDPISASRGRDAFGRLLYSRLTNWVVKRLNAALSCQDQVVNVIVAVDAAGFECSSSAGNGMDQLMRNYATERISSLGEELVYTRIDSDFAKEGVDGSSNCATRLDHAKQVVELFEREESGIIALCANTELAPIQLVSAVAKISPTHIYTTKGKPNSFTLRHTSGDVTYDVTNFRKISACAPNESIISMLKRSLCAFIKNELFSTELPVSDEATPAIFARWKPPTSLMQNLKFQLDSISRMVQLTEPRFTFCIRPNETVRPDEFNLMVVVREIRACGLIKYLDFLANALIWRVPFEEFATQFHALYPEEHNPTEHDARANCESILTSQLPPAASAFSFGKTRVYLARQEYQILSANLLQVQAAYACPLQALARTAILRGDPSNPKLKVWDEDSGGWVTDEEASNYSSEFDKITKASTSLIPHFKGLYVRGVERHRLAAEAELAKHTNAQPAQAEAELDAAAEDEWQLSQTQQHQMLAQNAVDQAQAILEKFDVPDKEGPLIMGTAFADLADPETGLVTREAWNAHFGKDNFDKYDEDHSGIMDKHEWDEAFKSYASDFLSHRIGMFYEGTLKIVQREIEDKTEEEQNMHFNIEMLAAEDNYLKLLEEADMRKVELAPDVENRMMAEEDKRSFQLAAIIKAEDALRRLSTLEEINLAADTAASSAQPPGFGCAVDPAALEKLVDGMVAQTKSDIESGVKMSPEKKQQQQQQMDNIHWQRVEERIMERENRKMIEMGLKLDSPEARSNVADEIEAEARESEQVLQSQMNALLEMFGAPSRFKEEDVHFDDELVATGEGPVHRRPPYKGKYGFKYKHNKLETMSIHE
eukprot:TRINITY_DN17178_c0_g1_i17.p1 TRINITY_DN17178_c0_g1~~TRINITY_DN17178_c0_g1_i17.p1  ORF type:complete len:1325 (+),score=418.79 TRINITY_DN17178_c0_g1_i17:226-4200(+)